MPRSRLAWLTAQRRRSGLRSFPRRCPSTPAYPGSTLPPAASASRSPAPAPSAAVPGPPANRHTLYASGSRSAPRFPLPYTLVASSFRSPRLLRSASEGSLPVPHYASCLAPSSAPLVSSLSQLHWHRLSRAPQVNEETIQDKVLFVAGVYEYLGRSDMPNVEFCYFFEIKDSSVQHRQKCTIHNTD